MSQQKWTDWKENDISLEVDKLEIVRCLHRSEQIGRRMMSQQKWTDWKENDVSRSGQIGRRMMSQQKWTDWKENDVSLKVDRLEGE